MERAPRRPATEIGDDGDHLQAPVGRLVDLHRRGRRKLRPAHEAARFEFGQALRQHVRADSGEVALQIGKAARAVSQLAKNQHGPTLAEQFQRMREAAGVVVAPPFFAVPQFSYFF